MLPRAFLLLLLASFVPVAALSQVEPSATGGSNSQDDSQMQTPPPVSGMPYANTAGADARSNFLNASISGTAGYIDNLIAGSASAPVGDAEYSINPAISISQSGPREQFTAQYSPGFSFYDPTSSLNTVNQSASMSFRARLSPHLTVGAQDSFLRTNDVFTGSYPFSGGGVNGSTTEPVQALIFPFENQMSDTANGYIDYQVGKTSMIGGGVSCTTFSFPDETTTAGLSNSDGEGGSAFYSRRFASRQYGGLKYSYSRDVITDAPYAPFNTQLHSLLPFYTFFFNPKFSLSISAGIQHVSFSQLNVVQSYSQWSAAGTASMGWQGNRGNFALSYAHSVYSGEGFAEAITSDDVAATGGWKPGRAWTASFEVSYANSSPVTTQVGVEPYAYEGGNSFTLGASLLRNFGDHVTASMGYDRLQEYYPGIAFIAANPDSDREYVTVTYIFRRPIGR